MWTTKFFSTLKCQTKWIELNSHRYDIEVIFVENGYAVQYRKVRFIGFA